MSEINSIKLPDNVTYDIRDNSKVQQYSTMPTASADYVDAIVQYIGTTGTYTNGYFYKCVDNSGSYSWVAQNVQAGGGSGSGDMTKAVYDTNDDGVVNEADVANAVTFSKTGGDISVTFGIENSKYGYYDENNTFVDFKSQADIDSAVAAAKVGTATAGDVLSGKTFTNSTTSGVSGSMTNNGAVSPSGLNCGGSYTIPAGYHNGNGVVTANSLASQTTPASGKTAVGAGQMLTGYSGWVNGSQINGTMANNGSCGATLTRASNSKVVAAGYTSGGTISVANGVAKIGTTDKTWGNGGSVALSFGQSLSVGAGVYYAGTITAQNPSGTLILTKQQGNTTVNCKSYENVNTRYPWQVGVEQGAATNIVAATGGSDCFADQAFVFGLWAGCKITFKIVDKNIDLVTGDILQLNDATNGLIAEYSLAGKNVGYTINYTVPSGKQLDWFRLYLHGTGVYKVCNIDIVSIQYID